MQDGLVNLLLKINCYVSGSLWVVNLDPYNVSVFSDVFLIYFDFFCDV